MVAICCNLVLSAPSSYYLKRYVSTGPPFSENWFPNDTTVGDTVVAPNGSVYVLDSSQALYKFDDFSHGIQKVQLTPPDNPPSSWAGTDIRTIQLWIHPVSYDPYLFRMRWSNATNSSESVLIDIIWYPGFNFSFVNSTHRPEIVTLNTTMSPGSSFVNFSIGRETQSDGEPIQLALYNGDNYYYLALVDMNIGTQTPAFLSEYSNSIPASIKLFGIVLECGRQVDLACLITSDNAVSTNFLFTPSAIQPISNSSLDWYFTPDTKINLYQNPHPNVTVIVVNDNFHLVFHVTQTSVSIQNGYLIPMSDTLPYDFSVTKNVFTVLTAVAEFSGSIDKPDINIKIYIHTINNNDGYLAMAELRTLQNETVSRLIKQPDESLTVVGTTFGNYSAPSSLTGLVDPDGFAYQALFFVRFLNLRIVSQSFEFINIENNTIQIVLVLDGVTQADSPDVIASMSQ
ncbi:hypothetical protein BKA69DRAFT_1124152 [Paraphysoderma sedebokerense]|nr:hypothetical protein BKA69DRAFT_1124152 [Paraphysoderma sedebokerense]